MNHTDAMLSALEALYTTDERNPLTYSKIQRAHILRQLGDLPQAYTMELYNEASRSLGTQFRILPDISVFDDCMKRMGRPETYTRPKRLEELPYNAELDRRIEAETTKREQAGIPIWRVERDRVRETCRMGNATKYESWWLYWHDTHSPQGGRTVLGPMPAEWDEQCYDGRELSAKGQAALGLNRSLELAPRGIAS